MTENVLMGKGRDCIEFPREKWLEEVKQAPRHCAKRLGFMTAEHHRIRYFVVKELPRAGKPIVPERIAGEFQKTVSEATAILDDLEKNLFFLVRNDRGAVSWAFPVTVDRTPHRLTFSTGERLYAA